MPVARMKMKPWLEKMIDSDQVTGLAWVSKEEKIFSITWKHAARHGWEVEKDASLFKHWAIHTGKYREGVDESDPKKWKANFRCAMNSLPDVEQIKCKSVNKGQQAVRVYRMMELTTTKDQRAKSGKRRVNARHFDNEKDIPLCTQLRSAHGRSDLPFDDMCSTQDNKIDSTDLEMMDEADFEAEIEIKSDSAYGGFEVSPEVSPHVSPQHTTGYEYSDDIVKICQQLELENWTQGGIVESNSTFGSDTNCSPWSDSSSDELELKYHVLGEMFHNVTAEESWGLTEYSQYEHPIHRLL
ncbi:Interferon regulatory factor 2 [Merluccius polli]|uniref:Interferon regulatory factor 2 n=1 Tax=Merluccius polli TaxID=89951 RepID=A0AA47N771_MERPO|nr:Interferon regulatory factor 2 [Merluccius polli]